MKPRQIELPAEIERKDKALPRFATFPLESVAAWALSGTTSVEVAINGTAVGRRNLKKWGKGRDVWFVDLPDRLCAQAGVETGDQAQITLRLAADDTPAELQALIKKNVKARAAWEQRTPSEQRMLRDHILEAKRPETRERRARKALLGKP